MATPAQVEAWPFIKAATQIRLREKPLAGLSLKEAVAAVREVLESVIASGCSSRRLVPTRF